MAKVNEPKKKPKKKERKTSWIDGLIVKLKGKSPQAIKANEEKERGKRSK